MYRMKFYRDGFCIVLKRSEGLELDVLIVVQVVATEGEEIGRRARRRGIERGRG